ncbi:unnamed protein product, partial [Polarella glacialis]
ATSVEPVESSGLRSLPRLQKFTQVGRRYLMVSGIAVQMLLLLLCADQAWNVSTSASAVLSFHAVAFGDKMYGDQYEQYRMLLGIPPVGNLIREHGPGRYAIMNRGVILFRQHKKSASIFRKECDDSDRVTVSCQFGFVGVYQLGTLLKLGGWNDQQTWDAMIIAQCSEGSCIN